MSAELTFESAPKLGGIIPLLIATGPGSEIQRPLAAVVIGGLVTSTLLTLVLLPILFGRFGIPGGARQPAAEDGPRPTTRPVPAPAE